MARIKANTNSHILGISLKSGIAINGIHDFLLNNHPKDMYAVETILILQMRKQAQRGQVTFPKDLWLLSNRKGDSNPG